MNRLERLSERKRKQEDAQNVAFRDNVVRHVMDQLRGWIQGQGGVNVTLPIVDGSALEQRIKKLELKVPDVIVEPTRHPFEVFFIGEGVVQVTPGTVDHLPPTTVGGDANWVFTIPTNTTRYVVLTAELTESGSIDTCEISIATSITATPDGDDATGTPPGITYRGVAECINVDDVVTVNNYLIGSQWLELSVSRWTAANQVVKVIWHEGDEP